MNNDQKKGKRKIQIIFGIYVIFEVFTLFMTLTVLGPTRFFIGVVRTSLSLWLFYCIFKRKNWASVIIALLFLLGGLPSLISGVTRGNVMILIPGALYVIAGVTLLGSKDVEAYMKNLVIE